MIKITLIHARRVELDKRIIQELFHCWEIWLATIWSEGNQETRQWCQARSSGNAPPQPKFGVILQESTFFRVKVYEFGFSRGQRGAITDKFGRWKRRPRDNPSNAF